MMLLVTVLVFVDLEILIPKGKHPRGTLSVSLSFKSWLLSHYLEHLLTQERRASR